MREKTRTLIAKANKDLGTAGFALQSVDGPLPVTTALHCQQAAKNFLKAFLHEHGLAFSDQPNLTPLLESCISVDNSFEDLRTNIDQLEGYSIASRYPKASDSLQFRKEALNTTKRVKDFILNKLAKQ